MTYSAIDDPTQALVEMLDLADGGGARTLEDIFVGHTVMSPRSRVYGGQVLAQATTAAMRTVDEERVVHSLHAYFLRPGDVSEPITFGVERIRDGRSFSARRVHAYQRGRAILSAIASFQVPAAGLEHQDEAPRGMPDPESLPSARELLGHIDAPEARAVAYERPFDIRYITEPIYFRPDRSGEPYNAVWIKTLKPLPDDPDVHRAALAYASDYTLLEPVLRLHGKTWVEPGMNIASLDHAMWWHRQARADEWVLYVQSSPNASSARGLGVGRMFTRDGVLIATTAQEGMLRFPEFS
ncbi:acyl-CoA thioesterase II [Kocuria flava]|uniref:Acyl-CoA thioesterase 2 n=1 Tax=Kocuria flava TaxID=446860 RepID=A0A0U3GB65_9MICC|nr:acyl-CoA thioesterase II [Kocuria flava]ALU40363.1 acyl-CoA thioesterase II [Kocuria flava]MCJ8505789.1 acyl-CoA thioesterase II [Kocuria flava]PLC12590.1 acyl-CoA thioesterase II [Kocuria flava]GEO92993.1 acyl-CoA thioesterase II [Kocuria flava]